MNKKLKILIYNKSLKLYQFILLILLTFLQIKIVKINKILKNNQILVYFRFLLILMIIF